MKRFLITGGNGLLALNAALALRDRAEVMLLVRDHTVCIPGVMVETSDYSPSSLRSVFQKNRPDVVIHTAGFTNVDECEHHPDLAKEVNADLAGLVALSARDAGAKLIHISTDHLFSGEEKLYDEKSLPCPKNQYAQTKLLGEQAVLAVFPSALVARTNFYGWGVGKQSISDWVIGALRKGVTIGAYTDVFFTPILIQQLVVLIEQAVIKDLSGVVNFVSDERISKYTFAIKVAEVFELDTNLITPSSSDQNASMSYRPKDMSLDNSYLHSQLGCGAISVNDGLELLRQQEILEWPVLLSGSIR